MKKFEYRMVGSSYNDEHSLNELGKEGWELVAIERGWLYFKREVTA